MKNYVAGKVKEGDDILLQGGGYGFINWSACSQPTMEQSLEQRIATAMTRIAYLSGSMDNITCILIVPDHTSE